MKAAAELTVPSPDAESTLIGLLLERARSPGAVAAKHKVGGQWVEVTWGEVLARVRRISAGLVEAGVKPGERVAIFGATTLEWVICDLAVSAARAITVPIYASNTADECRYVIQNSEAVMVLVDGDLAEGKQAGRLSRIRQKLAECPEVRRLVIFEGAPAGDRETTLAALEREGAGADAADPKAFDARAAALRPDDPQCFIYTSGTTGDPKGVVLTHGNWAFEGTGLREHKVLRQDDSVLLFLPMAHSFAQVIKAAWLGLGFQFSFAESVDKLIGNLAEARPTILPTVPRVLEKVYNKVVADGSAEPGLKGRLFRWAMGHFDRYVEARTAGRDYRSLGWAAAERLVFAKIKQKLDVKLGGRLETFISGGAPLSRKIGYFFERLGYQVLEGYGLTETSAGSTVNRPGRAKIGSVGEPLPGVELKIAPDGEVLIRGPNVMRGYHRNPAATAEAIDAEGWLHSGDIGELDAQGRLTITDRKKDLIVTAGGKNVAPQNLENLLKSYPLVSQAMVHGDRRKYLSVLICVAEEPARAVLAAKGISVGSYAELAAHPEIQAAVQRILDAVNEEQPSYHGLKRFALADHEFTQETGELTPTLKVRRKHVTQKHQAVLDALYDEKFD